MDLTERLKLLVADVIDVEVRAHEDVDVVGAQADRAELLRHVWPEADRRHARREVLPVGDARTRYHVSLDVADRAGVLARVATAFSEHGVSIETVRQAAHGADDAVLVIVTHEAPDAALSATVEALRGLDVVRGVLSVMRVEGR